MPRNNRAWHLNQAIYLEKEMRSNLEGKSYLATTKCPVFPYFLSWSMGKSEGSPLGLGWNGDRWKDCGYIDLQLRSDVTLYHERSLSKQCPIATHRSQQASRYFQKRNKENRLLKFYLYMKLFFLLQKSLQSMFIFLCSFAICFYPLCL